MIIDNDPEPVSSAQGCQLRKLTTPSHLIIEEKPFIEFFEDPHEFDAHLMSAERLVRERWRERASS